MDRETASRPISRPSGVERTVSLPAGLDRLEHSALGRTALWAVRRVTGLDVLDAAATRAAAAGDGEAREGERFARAMGATLDVDPRAAARIPAQGPLVVVANHPFGFLDAASVCWLVDRRREDVRFLANRMMSTSSLARPRCFFVDAFGGDQSGNARALRDAMAWVRAGKCLVVFPSGEVMSSPARGAAPVEAPWNPIVARLVERTRATVVPLWVHGSNSELFHAAGRVHPRLRTLLLPHELRRQQGQAVRISVGAAIPPRTWAAHSERGELIQFLRARAELAAIDEAAPTAAAAERAVATTFAEIAPGNDAWKDEVRAGRLQELVAQGDLRVLAARGRDIPATMQEVGRQRERTFRLVGEGTGTPCDVNHYDDSYWQLVVVDVVREEVVGGYRMGLTSEILPESGVRGLYTHTLFDFDERLLRSIGPAIELGRSFVVPERQREAMPLHLLWRAICEFIARRPDVRSLFGPVSISGEFSSMSKDLLTAFLEAHRQDARLAGLVTPRTPPRPHRLGARQDVLHAVARSVDEVDDLVEQLECGARGIPPLLRHYLRLDAKVLAFNLDSSFGDCLDALITIDVPAVNRRILTRYFGASLDGYLAHHGVAQRAAG